MAQLTRLKLPGPRLHLLFWGGNSTKVEITFFPFACLLTFHQGCIIFCYTIKIFTELLGNRRTVQTKYS